MSHQKMFRSVFIAAFVLLSVACASKKDINGSPISLEETDAALMSEAEKLQAEKDAEIFADLQSTQSTEENLSVTGLADSATTEAALSLAPESGNSSEATSIVQEQPFYDPVGGESLGRVAYMLFSDRKAKASLLKDNPDLQGISKLNSDQKVYFSLEKVKPQPMYLTKGLLDRYTKELAAAVDTKAAGTLSVTIEKGDTLQKISQKLYGTTRYWTELYLLNHEKLSAYDKISAGVSLVAVKRDAVVLAPQSSPMAQDTGVASIVAEKPVAPAMPEQSVVITAPTPAEDAPASNTPSTDSLVQNNMPEQPALDSSQPATLPGATPALTDMPKANVKERLEEPQNNSSSNFRRIVYVALILTIAIIAFYMARPSKKQKFDMLDVTSNASQSARQKLNDNNKNAG